MCERVNRSWRFARRCARGVQGASREWAEERAREDGREPEVCKGVCRERAGSVHRNVHGRVNMGWRCASECAGSVQGVSRE